MGRRLHSDEVVIDEEVVRSLLSNDRPELADAPLSPVDPVGTDNVLWRIDRPGRTALVVRLPRTARAADALRTELPVLEQLADRDLPFEVPIVHHRGDPTSAYPHPWAVLVWLDGTDAWPGPSPSWPNGEGEDDALAGALAGAVLALRSLDAMTADRRPIGGRGGPLPELLDDLDRWLDDPAWSASELLDVAAVRRLADAARELPAGPIEPTFVHGDLLPGNLLLRDRALAAIIDWGSAAIADPAQDLAPAWTVLGRRGRRLFREAVGADDATWLRAMANEAQHAVAAILYYRPRRHPLADIMARSLDRLLADAENRRE